VIREEIAPQRVSRFILAKNIFPIPSRRNIRLEGRRRIVIRND
jgi:hypothetical protein